MMRNNRFAKTPRTDRWRREDSAPRLLDEVPKLKTLVLSLRDMRSSHPIAGSERKQHVVVSRAAGLFEIACAEPRCEEGGHDLTREILDHLRSGKTEFSGESECRGMLVNTGCTRVLQYVANATYGNGTEKV
ncbi:MAG TPA: hypothetical protein VHM70_10315 [Polyangiaceae bacterium]|jgi:hypothetical protein|nr:hypothetical protein [Polyangiaceae bacterium]